MRRKEREITDRAEIDEVIRRSPVCRLGMSDGLEPYVVPLCFGYDGSSLYFHCAPAGRKLDVLKKNPQVCVEFDILDEILEADEACRWGMEYSSVIATGTAQILEDPQAKREALSVLMAQYSDDTFTFPDEGLSHLCVIKVGLTGISAKRSGQE